MLFENDTAEGARPRMCRDGLDRVGALVLVCDM